MKPRRNQELFARTLMVRRRGKANKRLGEDDTGTVLARCHIWASPVPERASPAAQGRVRQPHPQTRRRIRQYPLLGTGTALFYDTVLDRAHSRLRS